MKATTLQHYRERILKVLVHVQQNLDEATSLERLAEVAGFSPFHFHRIFRGMVGETVAEHVRRLRLERAAMRLKHTDQPVTRIAFDAGYEAHEAFTRAFGAMFGVAPSRMSPRAMTSRSPGSSLKRTTYACSLRGPATCAAPNASGSDASTFLIGVVS